MCQRRRRQTVFHQRALFPCSTRHSSLPGYQGLRGGRGTGRSAELRQLLVGRWRAGKGVAEGPEERQEARPARRSSDYISTCRSRRGPRPSFRHGEELGHLAGACLPRSARPVFAWRRMAQRSNRTLASAVHGFGLQAQPSTYSPRIPSVGELAVALAGQRNHRACVLARDGAALRTASPATSSSTGTSPHRPRSCPARRFAQGIIEAIALPHAEGTVAVSGLVLALKL